MGKAGRSFLRKLRSLALEDSLYLSFTVLLQSTIDMAYAHADYQSN